MATQTKTQSPPLLGLNEREVQERRDRGQGNNIKIEASRSYADIIRQNVLTFINIVLFSIGFVLVLLGLYTDALLSVGIVALNVVIGVIQEARAKQQLDKIALLTRPTATVLREGQERVIDPTEIVLDDILIAGPGDQIVVDGEAVGDSSAEVDESLLTGEADQIPKKAGDEVFSGSFVVSGTLYFRATKVGAESFANQLTANARSFKMVKTPLQMDIDFVVRILVLLVIQMGILLGLSILISNLTATDSARKAAVIAGLIPNGLFFMISIAYAMGAVRMAGQGALIQQSNAVESMSNVNVLCLDKTGTLTANRINYHALHPLAVNETELRAMLGDFVTNVTASNRTADAIKAAFTGQKRQVSDEVAFSSALKWSALAFDDPARRGVFVLGALEMLSPYLDPDADLGNQVETWTDEGLRVLLFAHHPDVLTLHDADGNPQLPAGLTPLGHIAFSDELRPEARETLEKFARTGIQLKVISGDNPHTVASLAKQAGFAKDIQAVSGVELAQMDDAQFARTAEEATVFGRITPEQKQHLVQALNSRGHYVAMIGDGVNDVLSLKKAQIGIAMQSGSQATRGVADIVLLNDSFAALPPAFMEGQRIINGMHDILRLFLVRVFYMALLMIGVAAIGVGFPFSPINSSLITLLTVGVPVFFLAVWARPGPIPSGGLIRAVLHFVIPATFTIALLGLLVYSGYYLSTFQNVLGVDSITTTGELLELEAEMGRPIADLVAEAEAAAISTAQTALTVITILCGLVLIVFVEPPTKFWVAGDELSGDWRPTAVAILMFIALVVILVVPQFRDFFELATLNWHDYVLMGVATVVWAVALRYIWRANIFSRFLNLEVKESILMGDKS